MQNNNNHHTRYIEQTRFAIDIATPLQIQVGQRPGRMESTLIGICRDKYLIISMPKGNHIHLNKLLEEGTPLIVRYIHNGNAYGFSSAVQQAISTPERLLFISHPRQVEVYELRNYPRVTCLLPARLMVDSQLLDGSVIDLSRTGARFSYTADSASSELIEFINSNTRLDIQFPGSAGYTRTVGTLRDVHVENNRVYLGVSFDDIEGPQLANLLAYLLDVGALPEHTGLSDIIHKHIDWRRSVSRYIHATDDAKPEFALSADDCALGRWLDSTGKNKYGTTAEYQELYDTHRQLHEQIGEAVHLKQGSDKEGALELFNKIDIMHLSNRIAALLIAADEHQMSATESAAEAIPEEPPVGSDEPADEAVAKNESGGARDATDK